MGNGNGVYDGTADVKTLHFINDPTKIYLPLPSLRHFFMIVLLMSALHLRERLLLNKLQ